MRAFLLGAGLLAIALIPRAHAVNTTVLDTGGFEGYSYGNIAGQNGWTLGAPFVGTATRPVTQVDIVDGPAGSGKVIQFNNVRPGQASIQNLFPDLTGTYKYARVTFDFYRETNASHNNLDWWPKGSNPWWGIAWDSGAPSGTIVPAFNGSDTTTGFVPQVPNTWTRVDTIWDLENGDIYAWVNGTLVANKVNQGTGAFNGWYFNDWQTLGDTGYKAYVDNLVITAGNDPGAIPEPSSLALLGTGLLPLLALRRRKS